MRRVAVFFWKHFVRGMPVPGLHSGEWPQEFLAGLALLPYLFLLWLAIMLGIWYDLEARIQRNTKLILSNQQVIMENQNMGRENRKHIEQLWQNELDRDQKIMKALGIK